MFEGFGGHPIELLAGVGLLSMLGSMIYFWSLAIYAFSRHNILGIRRPIDGTALRIIQRNSVAFFIALIIYGIGVNENWWDKMPSRLLDLTVLSASVLFSVYPVFHINIALYLSKASSGALVLATVLSALALPAAMTLSLDFLRSEGFHQLLNDPPLFVPLEASGICGDSVARFLGIGSSEFASNITGERYLFWFDAMLKSVFLDIFDVVGCEISPVTHNRESLTAALLTLAYRTFVSVVVVGAFLAILQRSFKLKERSLD